MSGFEDIERRCGYVFKDKELLKKALTLSSYNASFNNQSLECLGDALLSFIVAEKYYAENLTEGEITEKKRQLLSDEALRPVSERLGLSGALIKDKGDCNNKKAVPSAYEAFTAAIYLDGGLESARTFAKATLTPLKEKVNSIAALQELMQANGGELPVYEKFPGGTPQSPEHRVRVTARGKSFWGDGANFAEAKRLAAEKALEYFHKD